MQLFRLSCLLVISSLFVGCTPKDASRNKISTAYITPKKSLSIGYATEYLDLVPKINGIKPFKEDEAYGYIYKQINLSLNKIAQLNYNWTCHSEPKMNISKGISLTTISCSGKWPNDIPKGYITKQNINNIKTNIISIDLNNANIHVKPIITGDIKEKKTCINDNDHSCIKPLLDSIENYNHDNNLSKIVAAINGGFFMRPYDFYHYNCFWQQVGRTTIDYTKPIDTTYLGNSLILKDGNIIAYDCALFGKNDKDNPKRPDFLVPRNGKAIITNNLAGIHPEQFSKYFQGLGGGSLLIKNGKYAIDWSGLNPFFEFAATSAIALTKSNQLLLLTSDGEDNKAGTFPFETANMLMTEFSKILNIEIDSAMTLDRGGSATLILCQRKGDNCKIISNSGSGDKGRPIFSGLGVYLSESNK